MKRTSPLSGLRMLLALWALIPLASLAAGLEPALTNSFQPTTPVPGAGNSCQPILTPDGRFLVFASTAEDLVASSDSGGAPRPALPKLNVYLKDRADGTTRLVSVAVGSEGSGGNGDSTPLGLSTNGQYVLFESSASDLIANDTNRFTDVFLRDVAAQRTLVISINTNGTTAGGASRRAVMTPDARFIAFASTARDLVAGDTNNLQNVFLRDLEAGQTTRISGGGVPVGSSRTGADTPIITPDGRFVAFLSSAVGVVPGVTTPDEVYVWDRLDGSTRPVSTNVHATLGTVTIAYGHAMSDDGRYVAFEAHTSASTGSGLLFRHDLASGVTECFATNAPAMLWGSRYYRALDINPDGERIAFLAQTGSVSQVYVWNGQTHSTVLVSADTNGTAPPEAVCEWPTFDPTGNHVAFLCSGKGLVTNDVADGFHLYVRNLEAGATRLIDSAGTNARAAKEFLNPPSLTPGARLVAFDANDVNALPGDSNGSFDVFVRDTDLERAELASSRDATRPSFTLPGLHPGAVFSLSADGRYLAFSSSATSLGLACSNGVRDVFVRDLHTGSDRLVSADLTGQANANGASYDPFLSGDGRWVLLGSVATNLVASDTNQAADVFLRDLQSEVTSLVSVNRTGKGSGDGASFPLALSSNGRYALFRSRATDLTAGSISRTYDSLYCRDLQLGETRAVASVAYSCAAMTSDGGYIAYFVKNRGLYIWDSSLGANIYTNNKVLSPAASHLAISPQGDRVACLVGGQLWLVDRGTEPAGLVLPPVLSQPTVHSSVQFSADGQWVTLSTPASLTTQDSNALQDVYLFNVPNKSLELLSRNPAPSALASGLSDSPTISSDGRFVAYRSFATNLVPAQVSLSSSIYLFDRLTGVNTLVSQAAAAFVSGNNCSYSPSFSADGMALFFLSGASDLAAGDFNQSADFFLLKPIGSGPTHLFRGEIAFKPAASPGHPTLTWPATPGKTYEVQYKSALGDPDWKTLSEPVSISGGVGSVTDRAGGVEPRFYRILAR